MSAPIRSVNKPASAKTPRLEVEKGVAAREAALQLREVLDQPVEAPLQRLSQRRVREWQPRVGVRHRGDGGKMVPDHAFVEQLVMEKIERNACAEINDVPVQKRRDGLEIVLDALRDGCSVAALPVNEFGTMS